MRKNKSLWIALGVQAAVLLVLILLNIFAGEHWIDSDMAAEMIFSELIAQEGGLLTTQNWYYSTEFRILYTQLIMVPLFHIFESWHVIRILTNIVTYVLLLGSYYYFMKPLYSKVSTVIYSSVILLLPISETIMTHVQMGNTYMPHMIILFFCFGMFLRLISENGRAPGFGRNGRRIGRMVLLLCYGILSVICGMSGVRYVLALQAPLVLTGVWMCLGSREFQSLRANITKNTVKTVLESVNARYLWYSMLGLICAMVGYLINIMVIAKEFTFQTYEATNFIPVFRGVFLERLQNTIGNLLQLFGYIENKGFLSIRGVISLLAFALLIGIVLLTVRSSRLLKAMDEKDMPAYGHKLFLVRFFIAAFILNTFVFVFTTSTMTSRYYITVFIFVLPILCMYFDMEKLPLDKVLVILFLCGTLGLASAKCIYSFVDKDKNAEEKKVAEFLRSEAYEFGYATYWNANIMTELTDGYVEVANIHKVEEMSMFYWSSPMKYYKEDYYDGKIFLLLTAEEAADYGETETVRNGRKIYEDAAYVVYHYDSVEELLP